MAEKTENLEAVAVKVLIVEDDPVIRFSLSEYLVRHGMEVVGETGTGQEAVDFAIARFPDVILMDISLPGDMDGIQAADQILKTRRIPVIYLTAMTERSYLERAKLTQPYAYLSKPVELKELMFSIEMVMYRRKMEERLMESEERYRSLVEKMSDGLGVLNEKGKFQQVNSSLCKMLGYSCSELPGINISELLAEKSSFFSFDRFKHSAYLSERIELTLIHKSGREIEVIFAPYALSDSLNGDFRGIAFTIADITERKIAERKLISSENLTAILHQIDYGILALRQPKEILRQVTHRIRREVFDCERVTFTLFEDETYTGLVYSNSSERESVYKEGLRYDLSELDPLYEKFKAGSCIVIDDFKDKSPRSQMGIKIAADGIRSCVMIPVFSSNKLVGVLSAGARTPSFFSEEKQQQARILAAEIGVLVTHSMLNQAFNNSKQLNNRILDLIPDTILIVDAEGKVVNYKAGQNDPLVTIPQGENFLKFLRRKAGLNADQARSLQNLGNTVLNGEQNASMEINLTIGNTSKKVVAEVRFVLLYNQQLLAIIRDITEQKEAQFRVRAAILHTQEEERKRFAADLHDGLGQILSALFMNLDALRFSTDPASLETNRLYLSSLNLLKEAITETRSIAHNLVPATLQDYGLNRAIEKIVNSVSNEISLSFKYEFKGDDIRFDADAESCLFRIAQELINNTIKHSKASNAKVKLRYTEEYLELIMEDNGIGFEHDPAFSGMGLKNLQSRAELVNGTIQITSIIGKGTRIVILVPMKALVPYENYSAQPVG